MSVNVFLTSELQFFSCLHGKHVLIHFIPHSFHSSLH